MLEGLEAIELTYLESLDNVDFRIDSEFYQKPPIYNPALRYDKVGNYLSFVQYGLSIEMNEERNGKKIYRMNEIHDMLCDIDVSKYADITSDELRQFKLHDNDVLFNRTNSQVFVGRTGIFKNISDEDFVFASYLIRLRTNEDVILPEYLTTFFNTKLGLWDLKRRARISINQSNINAEEIKAVKIPLLSIKFQKLLRLLYVDAHSFRVEAHRLYVNAEQLLLKELGGLGFESRPDSGKIVSAVKALKDSFEDSGRLDAEYYQPKYDELDKIITTYRGGYTSLLELIKEYSTGYPFESDSYDSSGFDLIRINNIKKGELDLSNATKIPLKDVALSKRDIVKENDLLLSMSGTIGNCCRVPNGVNAIINQRILRFSVKGYNPDVLCLLINSFICLMQLERVGTGGVQTNISSKDIFAIKIPILEEQVQDTLAQNIEESFKFRKQSKMLLEAAKKAVEIAIEENEAAAIKYLQQYM